MFEKKLMNDIYGIPLLLLFMFLFCCVFNTVNRNCLVSISDEGLVPEITL